MIYISGSNETDDGAVRVSKNSHLGSADVVYLLGPRSTPPSPLYALRHGGALATPSSQAQ